MKFFVITICIMFLVVMLYIDTWKYFITNHQMWSGLGVVPILLVANMCIGVYYNLAIWYKIADRTRAGATITIIGTLVTLLVNYFFIPRYGYMACAWATMLCYASMMVISYIWGQKVYRIPYATKKLLAFFVVMLMFYFADAGICALIHSPWLHFATGSVLLFIYILFVFKIERKELQKIPALGRFIK